MRKGNPGRFAESGSAGERPGFRKSEFVKSGESSRFLFVAARGLVFGERAEGFPRSRERSERLRGRRADLYKYKPTRCTQTG